jgi:hypothetical protein
MLTESRRMMIERAVMLGGSAAMAGAYAAGIGGAVQAAAAALFFLVCPGLALLAPARFALAVELALLVPVSLAVTALVSVALFFTGFWSGPLAVGVLIGLVVVGALLTVRPRSARVTAQIVDP